MATITRLSHDELQKLEHGTKILQEHLETTEKVVNESEALLGIYVPALRGYVEGITTIRTKLGQEVFHILRSGEDLKSLTQYTQSIVAFGKAVEDLDKILTPERVEKLRAVLRVGISGEEDRSAS